MTAQLYLSLSSDPEAKGSPIHHDSTASSQSIFRPWSKGQSNSPWQPSFTSVYFQTLKQRTVQLTMRAQLHLSLSSDPEAKDSPTHHDSPASCHIFRPLMGSAAEVFALLPINFRTRTLSDTGSYLSNILYKSVLYFTICLLQCWCQHAS